MGMIVDWPFFRASVEWQIKRARRHSESFAVGMVEISEHSREVLTSALAMTLRDCDLVSETEDNRKAVLFVRTTADMIPEFANRLWRKLKDSMPAEDELFVGAAGYPVGGTDMQALLQAAAGALAKSRESDTNPHVCCSPAPQALSDSTSRILIVDDDPQNRKLLRASLSGANREIVEAEDGNHALTAVQQQEFDLILLDVMMPGLNGFEVCRRLKSMDVSLGIPVILITALDDTQSRIEGITAGADDFITKPFHVEEVMARAASLIRLKRAHGKMTTLEDVMKSLATAIEAKDSCTKGHTDRVSDLAVKIGERTGLTAEELEGLRIGGILHDVGKIGIPERILNKEGPLNDEEWGIMRTHPRIGVEICAPLTKTLGHALDIILHHHEKLDGSSYPDGLAGEQISMGARIMAVVDIYDALTTDRPYRKALSDEEAFAILREEVAKGKLDGRVVEDLIEEAKNAVKKVEQGEPCLFA